MWRRRRSARRRAHLLAAAGEPERDLCSACKRTLACAAQLSKHAYASSGLPRLACSLALVVPEGAWRGMGWGSNVAAEAAMDSEEAASLQVIISRGLSRFGSLSLHESQV